MSLKDLLFKRVDIKGSKNRGAKQLLERSQKADLNFLPVEKRFYFFKHVIKTILTLIAILSVSSVIFLWGAGIYSNITLRKQIEKKKKVLHRIETLYQTIMNYERQYKNSLKRLAEIKKEIQRVRESAFVRHSAYASTAVLFSRIPYGVTVKEVDYGNGRFVLTGTVEEERAFRELFKSFESSRYIKGVRFFYLKKGKNGFEFKVAAEVQY